MIHSSTACLYNRHDEDLPVTYTHQSLCKLTEHNNWESMWGFDVHTVVLPRINVISDMTVCECMSSFQHFKGSRCLHPQNSNSPTKTANWPL